MVCKVGKGECIEREGWYVRWAKVSVLRGWVFCKVGKGVCIEGGGGSL